jgi:hypothetical protein
LKIFRKVYKNELNILLVFLSFKTDSHISFFLEVETQNLFHYFFLLPSFKDIQLVYITINCKKLSFWSDRPLPMGDAEKEHKLILSTKILMAVHKSF